MSNYQSLYWITRLDGFHDFLKVALFILLIIYVIIYVIDIIESDADSCYREEEKKYRINKRNNYKKKANIMLFVFFIFILTKLFLPTKEEYIIISAGGKTLDFIQKDSSINKIPSQTTYIISKLLDREIKTLKDSIK